MKYAHRILRFLPTIGILIFIGFYVYSAQLYPGGSIIDANSVGFNWRYNHWCNLLAVNGINGLENPARPSALVGLVILCSSMTLFFFQFADYFEKNKYWKLTIKNTGALAMFSAIFIFTSLHDIMTSILSLCGVLVIIGMIRALHINKLFFYNFIGLLCVTIIGMNNLFYFHEKLYVFSPIIQKVGFILILSWTIALNLKMNGSNTLPSRLPSDT